MCGQVFGKICNFFLQNVLEKVSFDLKGFYCNL